VEVVSLDLCSLASVRTCAALLAKKPLDVLVLNAGINANTPYMTHPDMPSCSLVFGVNFVAQYLLLKLLTPSLAKNARVVCLSSVMHHFADVSALSVDDTSADYAESKLAMNLLARDINRARLSDGNAPLAVAVNPGAVKSDIWRHVWPPMKPAFDVVSNVFITPDQGCATSVYAATQVLDLDEHGQPP
jgi:NAD(P)-dependent dehydrogenase (short-subunit alcohol dehydrogenase family)